MTAPRFGLRIPPCRSATEVAGFVRRTEEAGFDIAWLPDSQFLWRDVWATLATCATATSSIRLGTCVTNFETRHPSVTAAAVGTLDEVAPGRIILGVGTGDSSIKTLGLKPTRLDQMRARIELVRTLLRGDEADFDGRAMRLEVTPRRAAPIYMAANAPKALALAGELCDGVIMLPGLEPELIRAALDTVGAGAARAGRSLDALDICVGAICHVTDDEREAARIVKPYVVAIAQTGGQEALRTAGIEVEVPPVVGGIYPDMSHAKDWEAAADAADEWVTDETAMRYASTFCLVGTADYCAERLARAAEAGATSFYIRHVSSYTLPEAVLQAYADAVIPSFSSS